MVRCHRQNARFCAYTPLVVPNTSSSVTIVIAHRSTLRRCSRKASDDQASPDCLRAWHLDPGRCCSAGMHIRSRCKAVSVPSRPAPKWRTVELCRSGMKCTAHAERHGSRDEGTMLCSHRRPPCRCYASCAGTASYAQDLQGAVKGPKVAVTQATTVRDISAASFRQQSLSNHTNSFPPSTMQVCLPPSWLPFPGLAGAVERHARLHASVSLPVSRGSGLARPFSNLPPTTRGLNRLSDGRARDYAACVCPCCALRGLPSMCQHPCNFSYRATSCRSARVRSALETVFSQCRCRACALAASSCVRG